MHPSVHLIPLQSQCLHQLGLWEQPLNSVGSNPLESSVLIRFLTDYTGCWIEILNVSKPAYGNQAVVSWSPPEVPYCSCCTERKAASLAVYYVLLFPSFLYERCFSTRKLILCFMNTTV